MKQPLLSIAIPTWNRAKILEKALARLLPQILPLQTDVEFIISDNGSTDDTNDIIVKTCAGHGLSQVVHYRQKENTGYYGNFRKCKELATGKYFWLLSDNEIVNDGLIEYVVGILKRETNLNAIHLSDWADYIDESSFKKAAYKTEIISNDGLFEIGGYKLTLISSMIFLNVKVNEAELFEAFKGNSFLGFQLFLNAIDNSERSAIVHGTSLISVHTSVSFNVFRSFTVDMDQCIKSGLDKGVLKAGTAEVLMDSIIFNLTRVHYTKYKIDGELYGRNLGPIEEIDALLYKYLGSYRGYRNWLAPLKSRSRIFLICQMNSRRVLRKLKALYSN